MRGLVIAGTASSVGKTVATLAVIRALECEGLTVQPAKAGPDFIDPSHHAAATGRPSRTLDSWLEGEAGMCRNYHRGTGDICVVEGMMGLYDGSVSSTAGIAESLDLPVVLVVDASAGMESVAASALGFQQYAIHADLDIDVVGIIAQRAHGGRHEAGIRDALPDGLSYFGRIPPRDELELPERHLGLHLGEETTLDSEVLDEIATCLDAERLATVARSVCDPPHEGSPPIGSSGDRPRIALAQDAAFRFIYPGTRERLAELGEVVTFAPTAGDDLPSCDGVYLPGGYPELHAEALASAPALPSIAREASDGLPMFGECGGLMALAESLTTTDGDTYTMAGVLPVHIEMHDRYQALDMVELRTTGAAPIGALGTSYRGHEFHYSSATADMDARFAFETDRGTGIDGEHDGLTEYATTGTYAHFHAESGLFDTFVEALS